MEKGQIEGSRWDHARQRGGLVRCNGAGRDMGWSHWNRCSCRRCPVAGQPAITPSAALPLVIGNQGRAPAASHLESGLIEPHPIGVRLVRGDLYWLAPTWKRPWNQGTVPAHLARVRADDRERKTAEARDSYPVDLAGYANAQLWVFYPRSHDFIKGPSWRQWLTCRSMRLVLQNATGERFIVKAPKGWQYEAPLDPEPK